MRLQRFNVEYYSSGNVLTVLKEAMFLHAVNQVDTGFLATWLIFSHEERILTLPIDCIHKMEHVE